MEVEQNLESKAPIQPEFDPSQGTKTARFWLTLIRVHDYLFSEAHRAALKRLIIKVSIAGFGLHLSLIFLARNIADPPLLVASAGRNYLSAISTPFSFILFYEVLTLIAAMPASTTQSIANQFEVISLIFIRDVFRDIATASESGWKHVSFHDALPLLVDMCSGLLMFLLVTVFQQVAFWKARRTQGRELSPGLKAFIAQKKLVAIGLTILLLAMAASTLSRSIALGYNCIRQGHAIALEPDVFIYHDVFTVMVFTDVLILILSLGNSGRYDMVFRNAAFVISIILVRFSMTADRPYGAVLAVFAMLFAILTILVFTYHGRIRGPH